MLSGAWARWKPRPGHRGWAHRHARCRRPGRLGSAGGVPGQRPAGIADLVHPPGRSHGGGAARPGDAALASRRRGSAGAELAGSGNTALVVILATTSARTRLVGHAAGVLGTDRSG